mgnify:FL=1
MKQRKITAFRIMCLLIAVVVLVFLGSGYRIIILLLSIFSALVFGRLWCGYVCPLGFYQELLSMLRKKLHIPTFHVSLKVKSYLRPLKWIILVYFLASVLFFGLRPVMYIRPDLSFSSADMSIYKIIIVGIVTGICFLKERAFCKYCPLGTLRGFVNKISFGKIKKDGTACTHCRACLECCPMDIRSIYEERNKSDITHSDCIYCMKCIEACPEQDVLSFTLFGKKILSSKRNIKQVK